MENPKNVESTHSTEQWGKSQTHEKIVREWERERESMSISHDTVFLQFWCTFFSSSSSCMLLCCESDFHSSFSPSLSPFHNEKHGRYEDYFDFLDNIFSLSVCFIFFFQNAQQRRMMMMMMIMIWCQFECKFQLACLRSLNHIYKFAQSGQTLSLLGEWMQPSCRRSTWK